MTPQLIDEIRWKCRQAREQMRELQFGQGLVEDLLGAIATEKRERAALRSILRLRYPRLLEKESPLYDGLLASAVKGEELVGCVVHTPDVVAVPREEWEALERLCEAASRAVFEVHEQGECSMEEIERAVVRLGALRAAPPAKEGGAT